MHSTGLRVLHVLPSIVLAFGGPVTNATAVSHALQRIGVEVSIYSVANGVIPQAGKARAVEAADLPPNLEGLDVRLFTSRFPHRFAFSPELGAALRQNVADFDVVHINSLFLYPQFAAFRESLRSGVPYVVTPHGALDPYLRRRGRLRKKLTDLLWQRRMLDQAAALHLTTTDECRLISDLNFKAPHVIVPNGLELAHYEVMPSGEAFRHRIGLGPEDVLILNHGRLSFKKGLDILIDAFSLARKRVPRLHLALVGSDDEGLRELLEQRAIELGIGNLVHFPGMLKGDALLEALAAADIWALPSHTENFGIAVVEAMAAGKPVITSPHVNMAPEAAAAKALIMVDNSPSPLANAIVDLSQDEMRRVELGIRAQGYTKRFDWSVVGQQYLEMYNSAIARHPGASDAPGGSGS